MIEWMKLMLPPINLWNAPKHERRTNNSGRINLFSSINRTTTEG